MGCELLGCAACLKRRVTRLVPVRRDKKSRGSVAHGFCWSADSGYGEPLQNKTAGIAPAAIVLHRKLSNGEQAQYGKDQCQTH